MNQLLLIIIILVLFTWFGGTNVPKILKDNKNMLLGIAVGIMISSYLKMEGVAVKPVEDPNPPNLNTVMEPDSIIASDLQEMGPRRSQALVATGPGTYSEVQGLAWPYPTYPSDEYMSYLKLLGKESEDASSGSHVAPFTIFNKCGHMYRFESECEQECLRCHEVDITPNRCHSLCDFPHYNSVTRFVEGVNWRTGGERICSWRDGENKHLETNSPCSPIEQELGLKGTSIRYEEWLDNAPSDDGKHDGFQDDLRRWNQFLNSCDPDNIDQLYQDIIQNCGVNEGELESLEVNGLGLDPTQLPPDPDLNCHQLAVSINNCKGYWKHPDPVQNPKRREWKSWSRSERGH